MDTSETNVDSADAELSEEAWDQLAECLEQFSSVWEKHQARQSKDPNARSFPPPNLGEFLPNNSPELRAVSILELIKLDIEFRSNSPDDWMSLEQYRERWPEICVGGQLPSELVYEEFQAKKKLGIDSSEEEYAERFPDEFASLSRLINGSKTGRAGGMMMPKRSIDLKVGDRVDDFDLLTQLGKGAFATVFLARQNSMQRIVALKVSADEGRESQTLAQLDHPHIVRVYDQRVVKEPPARLMYMQHVAGGTLQEAVAAARDVSLQRESADRRELCGRDLVEGVNQLLNLRGESVPVKSENRRRLAKAAWAQVVSQIGNEIAQALAYAHSKNVLHRDLKPANVLLDKDCHVKLVDFNISFCSKLDGASPAAYFGGSMAYMSPEQLEACSPDHDREPDSMDGRSDIFSAGVMLYELLVGCRPFPDNVTAGDWAGSMKKMIDARRGGLTAEAKAKLEPFGSILANTIERCLQGDPDDRFQHGEAMQNSLAWAQNPQSENLFKPRTNPLSRFANWSPFITVGFLGLGMSVFAVFLISEYNLDKSLPDQDGAEKFFDTTKLVANACLFSLATAVIFWMTRPVARILSARRRGEPQSPEAINHAIRRNLQLGHYGSLVSFSEWLLGGMIFPIAFWFAGYPIDQQGTFDFISSHFLAGLVTGAYVFWTVTFCSLHVWQPRLLESALSYDADLDLTKEHKQLDKQFGFYHLLAISAPLIAIAWIVMFSAHQTDDRTLSVLSLLALVGLAILAWTSRQVRYWLDIHKGYNPKDEEY